MKIKENVTVYGCDFCKKKMLVKRAMERHIEFCPSNPENFKKCFYGCKYLEARTVEFYDHREETERQSNGYRCSKLDQFLYSLKAERLGLPDKHPESFEDQKPMPKECEHFEC
jgi:hypothetical protein